MKIVLFLLLSTSAVFAQHSATLYPAYINATTEDYQQLIVDNAKQHPLAKTELLIKKHPVLVSFSKFKPRKKYSFISANLINGNPELVDDTIVFTFKNGKKYTVKMKKRTLYVYP